MPVRQILFFHQRVAADEVMVEIYDMAVAEIIGRQVIVLHVVGHHAAAQRGAGFETIGRQPLTVRLHFFPGVDGGKLRRDPAGFVGHRRVGLCPAGEQAQVPACLEYCGPDLFRLFHGAEQFQPRRARHAVPQATHRTARHLDLSHIEKFYLRQRPSVRPCQDFQCIGTLYLKTVTLALPLVCHAAVIDFHGNVIATGLGVKLDPVAGVGAVDDIDFFIFQAEQDGIADNVPVVIAHDDLFCLVSAKVIERINADV